MKTERKTMHYGWLRFLSIVAAFFGVYVTLKSKIVLAIILDVQSTINGGAQPLWLHGAIVAMIAVIVLLVAVIVLAFTVKKPS